MRPVTAHGYPCGPLLALLVFAQFLVAATPAAGAEPAPAAAIDLEVLEAYKGWAACLRVNGEEARAADVEARAGRLGKALGTETSVFIGFDPFGDLQVYAAALEAAGLQVDARSVRSLARAHRTEQMLRLIMHGGEVLDPHRYMGPPADYAQRLPAAREALETISGPGFTGRRPPDEHWGMSVGPTYMAFMVDTPAAVAMAARGQTFVLVVTLSDAAFAQDLPADRFPRAFEEETRATTRDRFRLVSVAATPRGEAGEYCVDFDLNMEERDNPDMPGVVLEIRTRGFACLDASSEFVLQAFYSERRPKGTPTMVDETLREQGEAFLRGLVVAPKREP